MIRAAMTFAHKGLAVFPCRPQDKRPATANGLKDASKDLDVIRNGGTPSRSQYCHCYRRGVERLRDRR